MTNATDGRTRGSARNRGPIATIAVIALLAAACSGERSAGPPGSTATASSTYVAELAYARCMQTHGLPTFPDPKPSTSFDVNGQLGGDSNSPAARANQTCEHLLPHGGAAAPTTRANSDPGNTTGDCLSRSTPPCYTPMQLRVAYGIQPLIERGIAGRGQTIVLPEFPPSGRPSMPASADGQVPASSDIRRDLAEFDSTFQLPAANVKVVNTLAHAASPWLATIEEVEDTEIVHALAPDASIREVLIPSADSATPGTVSAAVVAALQLGLAQASVISLSAGAGEQCFTPPEIASVNSILQAAQRERVTVVVSTGDSGAATTACPPDTDSSAVKGVDLPASDPLALAVGGTSLKASRTAGVYIGETAWNVPPGAGGPKAGGGGFSRLFARPSYQDGIASAEDTRGVPDVAADADPSTGMALDFAEGGHHGILVGAGGASAAAPLWAAVVALADQYAGRSLGFINPALYRIGQGGFYRQAFHDVTAGTNTIDLPWHSITGYRAAAGWDPVTGWGSPNAQALVPLLARNGSP